MFKLNAKFDADSLLILNAMATQYICSLTHWRLLFPLTSTVKSLFTHAHSSPLSWAARLHRCHTNHSCYIKSGWTFAVCRPRMPHLFQHQICYNCTSAMSACSSDLCMGLPILLLYLGLCSMSHLQKAFPDYLYLIKSWPLTTPLYTDFGVVYGRRGSRIHLSSLPGS